LLAEGVRAAGVPAEVVPDAAVAARVAEADKIWLGADTVFSDGTLLNGIGSLALARAAHAAGRPVEIIAESAKIVPHPPPENLALPLEMDRVPGELIAAVVSEDGLVFNRDPAGNGASADRR
jgi:translation initiation factor 2B subunit (eIF-2B alpha/beta/delta family)